MTEASTMLGSVLLMVLFRPIEWSSERDLSDDRTMIFACSLEIGDRLPSGGFLRRVREKDGGAIVVSNVQALTIDRSGIMNLEEKAEESRIGNDGRIKLDSDDLGVTGVV